MFCWELPRLIPNVFARGRVMLANADVDEGSDKLEKAPDDDDGDVSELKD